MRSQNEPASLATAPAAPVAFANLNKVDWSVIFVGPTRILNVLQLGINQNQAAGAKQRVHSPVVQSHVAVNMPGGLTKQCAFKVAPTFHHASEKFSAPRIERRIEADGQAHACRSRRRMSIRSAQMNTVRKMAFK